MTYSIYLTETKLSKNSSEFVGRRAWVIGHMCTVRNIVLTSDTPTKTFLDEQSAIDCIKTLPKNKRTDKSISIFNYEVLKV